MPRNRHLACSPAKPRAGFDECCAMPRPATLQPLYNFMNDLAGDRRRAQCRSCRTNTSSARWALSTSFDAGRGCPFQCSFCTIINVQGRKSRSRSPDDVERSCARTGRRESRILHHRRQFRAQQGLGGDLRPADQAAGGGRHSARLMIQVDTLCHKIPNFIEKASAPA